MTQQTDLFNDTIQPQSQTGGIDTVYAQLTVDKELPDGQARWQAVNPDCSYIVQAPAGSGKTSLLSQRFLALLSRVEKPEQIVAMTFTKKAAAEMRRRILELLEAGKQPLAESASLVEHNNRLLAQAVLKQDREQNWQLLQNPNRLRIKTIDGVNSFLVGQMPLLSKIGASSQISQMPEAAYQQAVQMCFRDKDVQQEVAGLLNLVNGRIQTAQTLLMTMLQKRDQWMGSVLAYSASGLDDGDSSRVRNYLQRSLEVLIAEEIETHKAVLKPFYDQLSEICRIAAYSQYQDKPALSVIAEAWPFSQAQEVKQWRILADWLLTKDSKGFRKRLTKNEGFPAGKGEPKQMKDAMSACLEDLREAAEQNPQILDSMAVLKNLPDAQYSDGQWQSLQQILNLLQLAVAYLKIVFQQTGEADFIEIAQAASQALGSEMEPTDLAQQLDYQIQHLLIDEFQDTSSEQFRLLHKLVAGWQEGDGRTLFVVGDPMQSIYRFREAEVGNFLKAWQGKIGEVSLIPLNLKVNFRSTRGVVDWVNGHFKKILPERHQISKGAVAYSDSLAFSDEDQDAVFTHFQLNRTPVEEARQVVALIQQTLAETASEKEPTTIAVLGRSRSHLAMIAGQLKQQQIAFRAVELESLAQRQEVQDVLAMTRAVLHQGDRGAWIALLRSPMVGLSLKELQWLIGEQLFQSVWHCITDKLSARDQNIEFSLSAKSHQRLQLLVHAMHKTWEALGTQPLAQLIRELWWLLDGPATLGGSPLDKQRNSPEALLSEGRNAIDNVEVFLQALEQQQQNSDGIQASIWDQQSLDQLMNDLYARADVSDLSRRVELMTMHKSKGLEFDVVILPGLERRPRGDNSQLLTWFEFRNSQQEHMVISPLDQRGKEPSNLTTLLKRFEKEKSLYEIARLYYVAATRAKKQLHLFASLDFKAQLDADNQWVMPKPVADSILGVMWPLASKDFQTLVANYEPQTDKDGLQREDFVPQIKRLPRAFLSFQDWHTSLVGKPLLDSQLPCLPKESVVLSPSGVQRSSGQISQQESTVQTLAQGAIFSSAVGKLVHLLLEQTVRQQVQDKNLVQALQAADSENLLQRIAEREVALKHYLKSQGVKAHQLNAAWQAVWQSMQNAYSNDRVCWALLASHSESKTEWNLQSLNHQGRVEQHFVDRSYVDEQGVRWIIDYKTSHILGEGVESTPAAIQRFIDEQVETHRSQLERYAELIAGLENRPQRKVLYFAYLNKWVEVE